MSVGLCGTSDFVAGSYRAEIKFPSGSELVLGHTDGGFEIETAHATEEVTVDRWGDSVVDAVYRGGNCFWSMTLTQLNKQGVKDLMTAWSRTPTAVGGEALVGVIGCMAMAGESNFQIQLILESPPGATNQPSSYLARHATLDPNLPLRRILNSRLRVLPVRLRLMPYVVGNDYLWYELGS